MVNDKTILTAIIATVAVLGLLAGVVIIGGIYTPHPVDARGCESSFPHSGGGGIGLNASRGRCFGH